MEQETPRKLTKSDIVSLLLFGAFQGALVGVLITLSNRHHNGYWDSEHSLLTRFIFFIILWAPTTLTQRILFPKGFWPRTPMGARIQTLFLAS